MMQPEGATAKMPACPLCGHPIMMHVSGMTPGSMRCGTPGCSCGSDMGAGGMGSMEPSEGEPA